MLLVAHRDDFVEGEDQLDGPQGAYQRAAGGCEPGHGEPRGAPAQDDHPEQDRRDEGPHETEGDGDRQGQDGGEDGGGQQDARPPRRSGGGGGGGGGGGAAVLLGRAVLRGWRRRHGRRR